jgi:hypothetical protein
MKMRLGTGSSALIPPVFKQFISTAVTDRWLTSFRVWRRTRILESKRRPQRFLGKVKPGWRERINDVIACPDNQHIPRVSNAGMIAGDVITMHNGIRIKALSYYGGRVMNMLVENKGVHEPQEERAFAEVLEYLPSNPVSLEMGAYWGFYSLWLKTRHAAASCHLVEPDAANLQSGRINFGMNGLDARFEHAFVSDSDPPPACGPATISVDGYCQRNGISHLHMLHSDIQGFEVKMLAGARRMFTGRHIDFVFISTHTPELHQSCLEQLTAYGYPVLCSVDLQATYSGDGLIVAKSPLCTTPERLEVSLKPRR